MEKVSIIIVCMNNLKNLYPCLESIRKYTSVSYECFVVAYLFSDKNLEKVRKDFPWVKFIESNEIRGFSENNNIALRQAKGKYCFVVNDDTEIKMPCIDKLVSTIEQLPQNVAIVSPKILKGDGTVSICGRPPILFRDWVMRDLHLKNFRSGKYINQQDIFKTYNISGCAFLIKTNLFREVGWFDERFFFCPEDIALSTELNNRGYECWVDADAILFHYEGMSGKSISMVQTATRPASMIGNVIFFSNGKAWKELLIRFYFFFIFVAKCIFHICNYLIGMNKKVMLVLAIGDFNTLQESFSSKTPKEIFNKYYMRQKINL